MTLSPALRTALALAAAAPLWLAACRQEPGNGVPVNVAREGEGANMASAVPSAPRVDTIAPTDAEAREDARPALSPEALKGEEGARRVLHDWAQGLEQGDWAKARAQWGHGGDDSGLDPDAFARAYAQYQRVAVHLGEGRVEGAAGSLYYEAPVIIDATLRDGRVAHLAGPVVLRRVNDVDGASPEDLAWHITRSDLKASP